MLRPPGGVPFSENRGNHAGADAGLSAGGAGGLRGGLDFVLFKSPPKGREILRGQLIEGDNAIILILASHRYMVA